MPLVVVRKSKRKPSYVDAPVPEPALRREHAISTKHEPNFARAFTKVARGIYTPAISKDLLASIRRVVVGEATIEDAVESAPWFNPADPLSAKLWTLFADTLERTYIGIITDAAEAEFRAQGWPIRLKKQESIRVPLNPASLRFVRERSAELVKEISDDQRTLLREILTRGFEQGKRPEAMMDEIMQVVGLTVREWKAVIKRNEILEATDMPDSAKRMASERYSNQLLQQRARRIARTETIRTYSQGLEDSWKAATDNGFVDGQQAMKEWVELTSSPRTCEICRGLARQRVPLGDSFVSDIIGDVESPPAHPHCRCTMVLVFPDDEEDSRDTRAGG